MYTFQTGIPLIDEVAGGLPQGSNLLILGPPLTELARIGYLLACPRPGDYTLLVTTDDDYLEALTTFRSLGAERAAIGLIDTVTRISNPNIAEADKLKFTASPTDLTSLGIKFGKMVEAIFAGQFPDYDEGLFPPPVRVMLNSISTLLMYRKLEETYQFLHMLTTRVKKMEGLGLYTLTSTSFDERTISVITQLMTHTLEVKREDDTMSMRIVGRGIRQSAWIQYRYQDEAITFPGGD
ncbi:RAD55 family ATPase [Methanosphaerula palustris]|uniref:KaiC-like domain-containing protein n=1 Tax=Methanosphaerula palustris (strain ATCC BAA-1556 / DSM 19958 / E1-9c) TaxID=521011 RepID=B8GIF7_METPE|nr:hypothetical protein [Methanosphaerula palustris]ACL15508.1 conserved hypothetical protein [Methanosphaerula palustris E1-9c]